MVGDSERSTWPVRAAGLAVAISVCGVPLADVPQQLAA
jgi:hypothetical protein